MNDPRITQAPDAPKVAPKSCFTIGKIIPISVVVLAIITFFVMGFDQYLSFVALRDNRGRLMEWYELNQVMTVIWFFITYTAVVALSLPGAMWMTLAGGFIFGTLQATFYVVMAATLGAFIVFILAQYCLADFLKQKTGKAVQKMEVGFQSNALSYLLFLRLVPLFPFWLVNLVPAFLGVPARTFIIGTALGIIPGSAVFCWVGSGLGAVLEAGGVLDPEEILFKPEIVGPIIGLAVLALVPIVYKKIKK